MVIQESESQLIRQSNYYLNSSFSIKKPGNNQQPNNSNNNGIISNQTNQNNIGFDEIFGGNSKSISQNTNINNHNNVNNNVFNGN